MRRRRPGERLALLVLLVTLGHGGMAIRAVIAQGSQDYINGTVQAQLAEQNRRIGELEQVQRWMFYTVIGGVVAQVFQILSAARARGTGGDRRHRQGD